MQSIKQMFESCGSDFQAMCDVVEAAHLHGTSEEFLEASSLLRREAIKRMQARTLQVQGLMLDRHLKGAVNKLAEEAGVPLDRVKSIQMVLK